MHVWVNYHNNSQKGLVLQLCSILFHEWKRECFWFLSDCKFNCHRKCAGGVPNDCAGDLSNPSGIESKYTIYGPG